MIIDYKSSIDGERIAKEFESLELKLLVNPVSCELIISNGYEEVPILNNSYIKCKNLYYKILDALIREEEFISISSNGELHTIKDMLVEE